MLHFSIPQSYYILYKQYLSRILIVFLQKNSHTPKCICQQYSIISNLHSAVMVTNQTVFISRSFSQFANNLFLLLKADTERQCVNVVIIGSLTTFTVFGDANGIGSIQSGFAKV